jgi:hypothetical protein
MINEKINDDNWSFLMNSTGKPCPLDSASCSQGFRTLSRPDE